jgi:5-methylcytosine-specific restriction endonuclease McrA
MKFWFVNLGKYYDEQRGESFLWAPINYKNGKTEPSWGNLIFVNKGDAILCNNKGHIFSIGIAEGPAYKCTIPDEFEQSWKPDGRRIDLRFIDIAEPLRFKDYKDYIVENINPEENPFDINGNAKQLYLWPIDEKIAKFLINKMNSEQINNLISFADYEIHDDIEELKEEIEQFEKINNGSIVGYSEEEINKINNESYKYVPTYKESQKKIAREKTDPKLKATCLEKTNYLCEIDHNHITFSNSVGEHQYMECHHIIPMNAQKDFEDLKLDSLFNLISLCPICHSQIHYANNKEKGEIFYKMYKVRENGMLEKGFTLAAINEIFNKYYKSSK